MSLGEIATAAGKTVDGLKAAIVADAKTSTRHGSSRPGSSRPSGVRRYLDALADERRRDRSSAHEERHRDVGRRTVHRHLAGPDASGSALGDLLEPDADLLRAPAEVVEARQRRQALEPEDALEQRRRAVA